MNSGVQEYRGHASRCVTGEVAVVEVLNEDRCRGDRHIIHHHTTDALQTDEGIGLAADLAEGYCFRLGSFVVAACVEGAVRAVVAVEVCSKSCGCDLLEVVAAIPHDRPIRIADGE